MKRFVEAKKLLALLHRRASALRRQLQSHRAKLADIDGQLASLRAEIAQMRSDLAHQAAAMRYDRSGLMRARGRQAVIKFGIACCKLQEADLIERRERIEHNLLASKKAVLAMEQRQNKHRDWLARQRLAYDLLRESMVEAELMEGRIHANQRY